MTSWLEELGRREAAARERAEGLRDRIAELSGQLAGEERLLERLAITRETMSEILSDRTQLAQDPVSAVAGEGGGNSWPGSGAGGGSPVGVMLVPPRDQGTDGVVLPQDYRDILEIVGDAWRGLRAGHVAAGLPGIRAARAVARAPAWTAGAAPAPDGWLHIDVDATITIDHSDNKENAAATWKKTFGYHPLLVFLDRPDIAGGEALAGLLRPGNAGSNTAADHISVLDWALESLPPSYRPDPNDPGAQKILVRSDSAGATHKFAAHCRKSGVGFSFGFAVDIRVRDAAEILNKNKSWYPAIEAGGGIRDGAWVAEATGLIDLGTWPTGTRLVLRKERPHPGAQLRFTDSEGLRITAFITDTPPGVVDGQLAGLELRHRQHARVEDRIRQAKATGLRNLPCHAFDANAAWIEIILAATDLVAWTELIGFGDHPGLARCEIDTFHYRVLHVAARITRSARQTHLRIDSTWRWATAIATAWHRLRTAFT